MREVGNVRIEDPVLLLAAGDCKLVGNLFRVVIIKLTWSQVSSCNLIEKTLECCVFWIKVLEKIVDNLALLLRREVGIILSIRQLAFEALQVSLGTVDSLTFGIPSRNYILRGKARDAALLSSKILCLVEQLTNSVKLDHVLEICFLPEALSCNFELFKVLELSLKPGLLFAAPL